MPCWGDRVAIATEHKRLYSFWPRALDVVAGLIILAYGVLCWTTVFQAYRSYEELWAFETDGPFYLILLDRLAHGELEPSLFYGYFPILAAFVFSLPVRLVNSLFGSGDLVTSLIIGFRLSQIFFVLLSGWLVYRITALLSSRLLGIICLISFFSIGEVLKWTAFLHPDIQQVAMTLSACYCLIKYLESRQTRYFFVSAIFAGFATASKFFGIFLIPAAAVAALAVWLPQADVKAAFRQVVRLVVIYAGIHAIAYLVASPPFLLRPLRNLRYIMGFSSGDNRLVFGNMVSTDLWERKALLLFDNVFLGRSICIAFVTAVIWTIAASTARRRIDGVHVVTAVILSYFVCFFALWGDVFNINGGYRYLLQPVALIPIVIAVGLYDAGSRLGLPGKMAAAAAACWILVLIIPFSATARAQNIRSVAEFYWTREQTGNFLVKNWIEENLPPGSRILTQSYLNIQLPGHIPGSRYEQGDRWRGKKDIRVYFDPENHVFVSPKAVAAIDPDFILSVNEKEVSEILEKFPVYHRIAKIGTRGVVTVLGKKDRKND